MACDTLIQGMLLDAAVQFIAIAGKDVCETARRIHGLSRGCTAAVGRTVLMTDMTGVWFFIGSLQN